MIVKFVEYARTVSDGNYGSEKIGIQIDLEERDTPEKALDYAKKFVLSNSSIKQERNADYDEEF